MYLFTHETPEKTGENGEVVVATPSPSHTMGGQVGRQMGKKVWRGNVDTRQQDLPNAGGCQTLVVD